MHDCKKCKECKIEEISKAIVRILEQHQLNMLGQSYYAREDTSKIIKELKPILLAAANISEDQ